MKVFAVVIVAVFVQGQTIPQPAPATPETLEHQYVRAKAETVRLAAQQIDRRPGQLQAFSEAMSKSLKDTARVNAQLANVDDCTRLFHQTIDKKNSDLTVRETTQIKACTDLDLYPLDMKTK
jgi:hypothetical protein